MQAVAVVAPADLPIAALHRGDIVFVTDFSLVSIGQSVLRLLGGQGGSGGSDAVHCFIVVDTGTVYASVAHVTNAGACINLISQPAAGDVAARRTRGRVYRLTVDLDGRMARLAADYACGLVEAKVAFGTAKSITSAFKDAKIGAFLRRRSRTTTTTATTTTTTTTLEMFCTEFVMSCVQAAIYRLDAFDRPEMVRALDIDGSACTPMRLEGFLRDNAAAYGDWALIGSCLFEYS